MQGDIHTGDAAIPPPDTGSPASVLTHFAWLRTRLSAERTLMSWNRTSLSAIGLGFVIYQWFQLGQQGSGSHPEATRGLALAIIVGGTLGTLLALVQYLDGLHYLRGDEFKAIAGRFGLPYLSLTLSVAVFSALIGIVTTVWIATRG